MRRHGDRRFGLALLLVLAACADGPDAADQWIDRSSWSYTPGTAAPVAAYGEPNTGGGVTLECDPGQNALHLVIADTDIAQDRIVDVQVADLVYRTVERLDPPDGFAVSRITFPLQEPVLVQYARGAGPLTVHFPGGAWPLPHAPEPVQMAQDCIQIASRLP